MNTQAVWATVIAVSIAIVIKVALDLISKDIQAGLQALPGRIVRLAVSMMPDEARDEFEADWDGMLSSIRKERADTPLLMLMISLRQSVSLVIHINEIRAGWGHGPAKEIIYVRRIMAVSLGLPALLLFAEVGFGLADPIQLPLIWFAYWGGQALLAGGLAWLAWRSTRPRAAVAWIGGIVASCALVLGCCNTSVALRETAIAASVVASIGLAARELGPARVRPMLSLLMLGVPLVTAVREFQLVLAHGVAGALGNLVILSLAVWLMARLTTGARDSIHVPAD